MFVQLVYNNNTDTTSNSGGTTIHVVVVVDSSSDQLDRVVGKLWEKSFLVGQTSIYSTAWRFQLFLLFDTVCVIFCPTKPKVQNGQQRRTQLLSSISSSSLRLLCLPFVEVRHFGVPQNIEVVLELITIYRTSPFRHSIALASCFDLRFTVLVQVASRSMRFD